MTSTSRLLALLGIVFLTVVIAFSLGDPDDAVTASSESKLTTATHSGTENLAGPASSHASKTDTQLDTEGSSGHSETPSLWPLLQTAEPVFLESRNMEGWRVSLDRSVLEYAKIGDSFRFRIPDIEGELTATFERFETNRFTEIKYARVDGTPDGLNVYFNLGPQTLYGTIETDSQTYYLEQNAMGESIVYSGKEIYRGMDLGVSDAVYVQPPD